MLVSQIFSYSRARTNTNSVTSPDATLFLYLNERHRQLMLAIQNAREDYSGEISTTDLIAGQQEYPLPDESMKIKRVEAKFDGTNWTPCPEFDNNERKDRASDEATVAQDFASSSPRVDLFDKSLFLFPIPSQDVTDGLKLWHFRRPQDIAVTNVSPEAPKEYHMYLVDLITLDIDTSRGRLSIVQNEEATEEILKNAMKKMNPRDFGKDVRMKSKRKNYR